MKYISLIFILLSMASFALTIVLKKRYLARWSMGTLTASILSGPFAISNSYESATASVVAITTTVLLLLMTHSFYKFEDKK